MQFEQSDIESHLPKSSLDNHKYDDQYIVTSFVKSPKESMISSKETFKRSGYKTKTTGQQHENILKHDIDEDEFNRDDNNNSNSNNNNKQISSYLLYSKQQQKQQQHNGRHEQLSQQLEQLESQQIQQKQSIQSEFKEAERQHRGQHHKEYQMMSNEQQQLEEYKNMQKGDSSENIKSWHSLSFKNLKTGENISHTNNNLNSNNQNGTNNHKHILDSYSTAAGTPISNQQNGLLSLRDKSYSFINKSMVSSIATNRNIYDEGWNINSNNNNINPNNNQENQKLFYPSSNHDLSLPQLKIASQIIGGNTGSISQYDDIYNNHNKFTDKLSQNNNQLINKNNINNHCSNYNDGIDQKKRFSNTQQTNTKLYIAFPEEQINNPEYYQQHYKIKIKNYFKKFGIIIILIAVLIGIIFMLYKFYLQ